MNKIELTQQKSELSSTILINYFGVDEILSSTVPHSFFLKGKFLISVPNLVGFNHN